MVPVGPSDPLRSATAEQLLPSAFAAADQAGTTRLADITRLDRIGLPVWQAIRPRSRALSVHQGKGATEADAQIGALLEAVESHWAESFDAEGPVCAFEALPRPGKPSALDDFAANRSRPPAADENYHWVEAEDLLGGGLMYVPFDVVSLDFTRRVSSLFDRASNGVATGATREEAIAIALHELIERDAVTEWRERDLFDRTECALDLDTVSFAWLHFWRERIEAAGALLRLYHVPSITGTPVFACEINDLEKDGTPYRANQGRGCHPIPEIALFKALAEAIQGRVTYIAGARDDLVPSDYAPPKDPGIVIAFGLPLPAGMDGVDFGGIEPGPTGGDAVAGALDQAGYGRIAVVDLARPQGLCVARAFVCGLGSLVRRRRAPLR